MNFNLAQVNVAVAKYDYDDPAFSGFVDNLDRINSLAESWPGFVWRYISDDDDAEVKRVFGNEKLLFNMSLWTSLADLEKFVYRSDHLQILQKRAEWFVRQQGPAMALWWQPVSQRPSPQDAKDRLASLAASGPTVQAFTFRNPFDAPASDAAD